MVLRRERSRLNRTEVAEAEREALFLNIGRIRGADFARRWFEGLIDATDQIVEFPGPRSFPSAHAESERRREEIRYRIYGGPDKRRALPVSCHIFFALLDARQGEDSGRVLVLRVIASMREETAEMLA